MIHSIENDLPKIITMSVEVSSNPDDLPTLYCSLEPKSYYLLHWIHLAKDVEQGTSLDPFGDSCHDCHDIDVEWCIYTTTIQTR